MLPEALVIFACLNSTGCSETSSLYFNQHPEMKHNIDRTAKQLRESLGPSFVDTVGPMIWYVAGGTGTIHLSKYFSVQASKKDAILTFRLEW